MITMCLSLLGPDVVLLDDPLVELVKLDEPVLELLDDVQRPVDLHVVCVGVEGEKAV